MTQESIIIWFRQDLRVEDHPALQEAIDKSHHIVPLYIYSEEEKNKWKIGAASKWWLHHSLESLSNDLKSLNLKLIIRKGDPEEELKKIIKESQSKAVYWSRMYEPFTIKRDTKIKQALSQGIEVKTFKSSLLFEPWDILNKQGKPFQVFTAFWKSCLAKESSFELSKISKKPSISTPKLHSLTIDELELLPKIHWDKGIAATWHPGTANAKKYVKEFIEKEIVNYKEDRDFPSLPGVSHMSPYLHFGEISPKMIWQMALEKHDFAKEESYLRQLGWREFGYHLLYHFPFTTENPLQENFTKFEWVKNESHLKAWQKGKTGYPFVDAGMRQLWKTGWMHNRLRLVVGSFLVKDLLINWKEGSKWFWDTLVDADLANNTLGWQWVGGCGADAAPYFRIFNPVLQSEKFDPKGEFIRKWIPEIAALPDKWLHKPWEAPEDELRKAGITLGDNYPYPIVNHEEARKKALEKFNTIKAQG
ncbi:MAG: deoxyribodipyrimidine photolyase [Chlamydia sp. 32-24]|nr:MAG: deoxyribodipyrimidine photolyase [Chlamydia sp. 32-24]